MLQRLHTLALSLLALLATQMPAAAFQDGLRQRVDAVLAQAPPGTRFGLLVTDEAGRELIAINPDGRFIPASNTKLLTTAAAYATLTGLDRPDATGGARVELETRSGTAPNVFLTGRGDARMSSAPECVSSCLSALADAVTARTRQVHDIIGDASLFPDQRWSPGMSWNNIHTRSGTGVSALSLDDNELVLRVAPGTVGQAPTLDFPAYFAINNLVVTTPGGPTNLSFERLPGGRTVILTGSIAAGVAPVILRLGIDNPADYAVWRFRALLESRGVRVSGGTRSYERRIGDEQLIAGEREELARLTPLPIAEDIVRINKDSQNLHAELLLRRLGLADGEGSIEDGVARIAAMMERAGVPRTAWDQSDGSGMSTYNRLSPRATVTLLRWATTQPWGAAWRASFPIAGVDGTLTNRFRGTPLERRLFAKTGSLNASNGLSGYLIARSGRTLTFSFFANDVPGGGGVTPVMDEALNLVAAAN